MPSLNTAFSRAFAATASVLRGVPRTALVAGAWAACGGVAWLFLEQYGHKPPKFADNYYRQQSEPLLRAARSVHTKLGNDLKSLCAAVAAGDSETPRAYIGPSSSAALIVLRQNDSAILWGESISPARSTVQWAAPPF
jgi:hypothetical protein